MLEFVGLGDELGADQLWLQRLVNDGTYDEATFSSLNVASAWHPMTVDRRREMTPS
ncbi:MAG: hypothetical protein ABIT71_03300 [Vicinamibacteraceae bacterium]